MIWNFYHVFVLMSLASIAATCEMPDEIPAHFQNNIRGNWTILKALQRKQMRVNGGCPHAEETALECDIETNYYIEVSGVCRMLEDLPTCFVFNTEYGKRPLMWPAHKTCVQSHTRRLRYPRRHSHIPRNTIEEYIRAKERATEGVLPENVDLEGNVMDRRECRALLFVKKALRGKCVKFGTEQYGCRSDNGGKLILMHPDCAYQTKQ